MTAPSARAPVGLGWTFIRAVYDPSGTRADGWMHAERGVQVLSSLAQAELPKSGGVGPQWHISTVLLSSRGTERPKERHMRFVRCAFDVAAAEEDNHHPGAARHLWMPVDPEERVPCECKTTEVVVTEPDGYTWTNPTDEGCRGCALEATFRKLGRTRPCPLHAKVRDTTGAGALLDDGGGLR